MKEGLDIEHFRRYYHFHWINATLEDNLLSYTLGQEKKNLDLTPHLEAIFAASKPRGDYERDGESYTIDTPEARFIFTSVEGEKTSNGNILLGGYVDGYLLLK